MIKNINFNKTFCISILYLMLFLNLYAQENTKKINAFLGAEIVSRDIWRGIELKDVPATPQLQPYIHISYDLTPSNSFVIGSWASYSLDGNFIENDIFLKYLHNTKSYGSFSAILIDYYYPYLDLPFNNFKNNGNGAHTIDFVLEYEGPDNIPISFSIANLLYNDVPENHSLYLELGYLFSINNINAKVHFGTAKGRSQWHSISTNKFEIVNIGLTVNKELKVTESFSLPLTASYILNWYEKRTYLILKLSI